MLPSNNCKLNNAACRLFKTAAFAVLTPVLACPAFGAQSNIGGKMKRGGFFSSLPANLSQNYPIINGGAGIKLEGAFQGLFLDRLIARLDLFSKPVPEPLALAAVEELELLASMQPAEAEDMAGAADILAARAAIALARGSGSANSISQAKSALAAIPPDGRRDYEKRLAAAIDGWRRASSSPKVLTALSKLGKDLPLLSLDQIGKTLDSFFTGRRDGMAVALDDKPADIGSLPVAKPASQLALKTAVLKTSDSDPERGDPESPLSVFLRVLSQDADLRPSL